jgi:hypothetical protein
MADPYIPPKVIDQIRSLGLWEKDILDVFHHGEYEKLSSGSYKMYKKYPSRGIEISLIYSSDKQTGKPVIVYVGKRDRR